MNSDLLNVDTWRVASAEDILTRLKERRENKSGRRGRRWINDGSISPLKLYSYLKYRFGKPNGEMMVFKTPNVDNLIHWHFVIMAGDCYIDFIGHSFRTEILLDINNNLNDEELDLFILNIINDIKTKDNETSIEINKYEKWILFENPYARLLNVIENHIDRLKKLDIENIVIRPTPQIKKDVDDWRRETELIMEKYHQAIELTTPLNIMVPVLGEALINLLIFILVKPEIRNDKRLYDDLLRKQIDVRIKSMNLYCDGFVGAIDANSQEFKDYQSLMNKRNDLLHANIEPQRLGLHVIYFDYRYIPLYDSEISMMQFALKNQLGYIKPADIYNSYDVVMKFKDYIMSFIQKEYKDNLEYVIEQEQLGWLKDKSRVGTILPNVFVESMPYGDDSV